MAKTDRFRSIHAHGFVRVGACTPVATVGDPAANAAATIALARRGHDAGADLLVFPELNITSYAIDDLHLQDAQLAATGAALAEIVTATAGLSPILLVGAALVHNARLYNCAVAIARGRVLGVVPKLFLPNYREYYEKRWFASGAGLTGLTITVAGQEVPFGADLIFAASDLPDFVFHAEICEDYWAAIPPSTYGALAGALVCCNLSASNSVIGKARERAMLSAAQSARAMCGYVFSATGAGESTTDLAWDGQGTVHELGELIAASARFDDTDELLLADVDLGRIVRDADAGCLDRTDQGRLGDREDGQVLRVLAQPLGHGHDRVGDLLDRRREPELLELLDVLIGILRRVVREKTHRTTAVAERLDEPFGPWKQVIAQVDRAIQVEHVRAVQARRRAQLHVQVCAHAPPLRCARHAHTAPTTSLISLRHFTGARPAGKSVPGATCALDRMDRAAALSRPLFAPVRSPTRPSGWDVRGGSCQPPGQPCMFRPADVLLRMEVCSASASNVAGVGQISVLLGGDLRWTFH